MSEGAEKSPGMDGKIPALTSLELTALIDFRRDSILASLSASLIRSDSYFLLSVDSQRG